MEIHRPKQSKNAISVIMWVLWSKRGGEARRGGLKSVCHANGEGPDHLAQPSHLIKVLRLSGNSVVSIICIGE